MIAESFCIFSILFLYCDKNPLHFVCSRDISRQVKMEKLDLPKKIPPFLFQETFLSEIQQIDIVSEERLFQEMSRFINQVIYTQVGGVYSPKFRCNCVTFRYKNLKEYKSCDFFLFI